MKKQIRISFLFTCIATIGLGIVYPLFVSAIGFFIAPSPHPLLMRPIVNEDQFQGRPSIHPDLSSGASNLALTNPELWQQVERRLEQQAKFLPQNPRVPRELLFASGSGYDPHISEQGALYQIPRIAQMHSIDVNVLKELVNQQVQSSFWGIIGSQRVNVIRLNKALEDLTIKIHPAERGMFRIKQ